MPVCLIPPPKSFLNQRAFLMNSVEPTRQDPIGAPETSQFQSPHKDILCWNVPSPLLKHKLTESNGSQRSFRGVPVSIATCHKRAPSRCSFTPLLWIQSEIAITSSCGMMVPLRVFSSATSSVGALYNGYETTIKLRQAALPVHVGGQLNVGLNIC